MVGSPLDAAGDLADLDAERQPFGDGTVGAYARADLDVVARLAGAVPSITSATRVDERPREVALVGLDPVGELLVGERACRRCRSCPVGGRSASDQEHDPTSSDMTDIHVQIGRSRSRRARAPALDGEARRRARCDAGLTRRRRLAMNMAPPSRPPSGGPPASPLRAAGQPSGGSMVANRLVVGSGDALRAHRAGGQGRGGDRRRAHALDRPADRRGAGPGGLRHRAHRHRAARRALSRRREAGRLAGHRVRGRGGRGVGPASAPA